jgi:hypothetical protein
MIVDQANADLSPGTTTYVCRRGPQVELVVVTAVEEVWLLEKDLQRKSRLAIAATSKMS